MASIFNDELALSGVLSGHDRKTLSLSEAESLSGASEQPARKRQIEAQSTAIAGYGEHLQRRTGAFWRAERA
ncbi:hypothetical protein [Massilia glaciei]|uniref:hypothetical protein n=1 Tax=Massilia glaciei TaxID=1524097 RepID=UPI0011B1EBBE|nr:hypothetical protein [Massilia glaciei]